MAFTNRNDYLTGRKPVPTPAGGELVACRFGITLTTADLDANDVGAVGLLPPGCVPVHVIVDTDDLDTNGTPTNAFSVGFVNDAEGDLDGTAWATGLQTARTGGTARLDLSAAALRMAATQTERKIGVKFTSASATKAGGEFGLTVVYRAA